MPGAAVYYDSETGIKIIRVYNNPFTRTLHAFAEAEDTKTHKKEKAIEKYWVPTLSREPVNVGSPIFLSAIEPGDDGMPAMSIVEGRVVRLGADLSSRKHLRIHTSLPFKPSYRGAPVLNASKAVVGIVSPTSTETSSVLIPSQYLLDALLDAKSKMIAIK